MLHINAVSRRSRLGAVEMCTFHSGPRFFSCACTGGLVSTEGCPDALRRRGRAPRLRTLPCSAIVRGWGASGACDV